ncbi:EamA family transporter [Pseudonocardia spinosispora]|uniref:EamA family transporter n=1 Tax=Pseudonocardia spinosispora TaxID=103441 RepID=UPI00040923F5|nr:EamA family transporter [Pseudonocardia spinosispora]
MGLLLALASSVCYGIADFTGGLLSRRANFAVVALVGQAAGLVFTLVAACFVPAQVTVVDVAWGGLSGIGTGVAMAFLYRGLSRGAMSVVVPISAVGGLAIPVLVGVAVLGDRPSTLSAVGIVVSVPALWLVSRAERGGRITAALGDGLISSVGIGLQYLALASAGPAAGIWPVVAGRVTATLAVVPLLRLASGPARLSARRFLGAAATGGCAALALVAYLVASRQDLLAIVVVLSSLYPAIPVLLGLTVLRERLNPLQVVGLLGTALAVTCLTAGH